MKTENKNSEKDLNANPESRLNTNKSMSKTGTLSNERLKEQEEKKEKKGKKHDNELTNDELAGTVGERSTSSSPSDIAGISDLDHGMRRAKK